MTTPETNTQKDKTHDKILFAEDQSVVSGIVKDDAGAETRIASKVVPAGVSEKSGTPKPYNAFMTMFKNVAPEGAEPKFETVGRDKPVYLTASQYAFLNKIGITSKMLERDRGFWADQKAQKAAKAAGAPKP